MGNKSVNAQNVHTIKKPPTIINDGLIYVNNITFNANTKYLIS